MVTCNVMMTAMVVMTVIVDDAGDSGDDSHMIGCGMIVCGIGFVMGSITLDRHQDVEAIETNKCTTANVWSFWYPPMLLLLVHCHLITHQSSTINHHPITHNQ